MTEMPRPSGEVPTDILPVIRAAGILSDRQYEDVRSRVLGGSYPLDSRDLANRLIRDGVLTEYQARRILSNKPHGMIVGKYVIQDRIGSGSMGRVYRARHQLMDRLVALKIISPEIITNSRVVARFQREMRMVGRLDDPNVVRAFDADQIGNNLYIVMEYVPGQSLGQKFKKEGPQPPAAVAEWGAQAARGLAHAHEQGIVHRDVKPSNLLLHEDLKVIKVLDLGLGVLMEADEQASFATADGIAVGTIDYMSPEQACGKEVDGRSDIYSLGCTMYHLISGKLPFPGETPVDRLGKRLSGRPVPILEVRPGVPAPLVRVLEKMMAARPHERYQTAAEAADALAALTRPRVRRPAPAASAAPSPVEAVKPLVVLDPPQPAQKLVTVQPTYPAWFRPLAQLVEKSPLAALLVLVGIVAAAFGAGFLAAKLLVPPG